MHFLRKTLRLWWQKPKNARDAGDDRSVSFLELFYDLAYVVIIAELTHALVGHVTWVNIGGFVALFALVWFAWVNGTFYHELHGNNDIRTRILTFLQMLTLAGMAVFAHSALGAGYQGFALSYAAFLLIVTWLWWRTGVHDPTHRPMSQPYAIGFLVTTIVFAVSAFVPMVAAHYLWIGGAVFALLLPLLMTKTQRRLDPAIVEESQRVRPSLVERFGLLTIIVLGEVIVAVVQGASHHEHISGLFVVTMLLGLVVAIGMWWVYFDFISHHMPIQRQWQRFGWLYLHLPTTMMIALSAAGLLTALESESRFLVDLDQWLLIGPVAIFLTCVVLLNQTITIKSRNREIHNWGSFAATVSAILILMLGFINLPIIWLLVAVVVLLVAPVYVAFRMWVRRMYIEQRSTGGNQQI